MYIRTPHMESRLTTTLALALGTLLGCSQAAAPPPPDMRPGDGSTPVDAGTDAPAEWDPTSGLPGASCCQMMACDNPTVETFDLDVDGVDGLSIASGVEGSMIVATRTRGGLDTVFLPISDLPDPSVRIDDDAEDVAAVAAVGEGFVVAYRVPQRHDDRLVAQHMDTWGAPVADAELWADDFTASSLSIAELGEGALAVYGDGERVESLAVDDAARAISSADPLGSDASGTADLALAHTYLHATMVWYEEGFSGLRLYAMPLAANGESMGERLSVPVDGTVDGTVHVVSGPYGTGVIYGVLVGRIRHELRFHRLDPLAAPHGVAHMVNEPGETGRDPALAKLGCGYAVAYRADGYRRESELRLALLDEVGDASTRLTIDGADADGPTAITLESDGGLLVAWIDDESHSTRLHAARVRCEP